jgi:hypothetical protein
MIEPISARLQCGGLWGQFKPFWGIANINHSQVLGDRPNDDMPERD